MTAHTTDWMDLPAGACAQRWLAAGTTLVVLEGALTVESPPRWLADHTLRLRHTIGAGHAYVLDNSGWWALHGAGRGGVQLRIATERRPTRRLAPGAVLRALLGWAAPRRASGG